MAEFLPAFLPQLHLKKKTAAIIETIAAYGYF